MQKLVYIPFIFFLIACEVREQEPVSNKETFPKKEETTQMIASQKEVLILEEEDEDGFIYSGFDGVIITKADAYEQPSFDEEAVYSYQAASFVMVEKKGARMDPVQDNDECRLYGYHWYQVSEGADIPMWIDGESLFLRSKAKANFNNNQSKDEQEFGYKVKDAYYRFDMASTSWEEPENADGPSYCYDYGFPFFYQDDNPNLFPIIISNEVGELGFEFGSTVDGYLLILLDSDGGGCDITDFVEKSEGVYEIHLNIGYQDGMATAILYVMAKDEQFILNKIERTPVEY